MTAPTSILPVSFKLISVPHLLSVNPPLPELMQS